MSNNGAAGEASSADDLEHNLEPESLTLPNPEDLEAGINDTLPQENATIGNLSTLDRILCGALFATTALQLLFSSADVKDQLSAAYWIALTFNILWLLILSTLLSRHLPTITRHAKTITLTAVGLCALTTHFLDLTPAQVVTYLPLIITVSLAAPFTGSLLESLSFGAGEL